MDKILSIIVPSYNMEAYLPKCLGSLIVDDKELLQELEVIVVNDGSKDRTSEIAHEFEAKYPGVFRVIDKPNGHFGSCINAGLACANGMFVKTLDADDYYDIDGLATLLSQLRMFDSNDCPDLVISDYCHVGGAGDVHSIVTHNSIPANKVLSISKVPAIETVFVAQAAIAYKRSMLLAMKYVQTEGLPYTDCEWYTRPWGYVKKVYYLPNVLYFVLTERSGRTMEAQTYAKGVGVIQRLILNTLAWFIAKEPEFCDVNAHILRAKILDVINHVYSIYILGYSGCYPQEGLKAFDNCLKKMELSFYEGAKCTMPILGHRMDVLKLWRKNRSSSLLQLVRCNQRIRKTLSTLKRIFCKTKA